VGGPKVTTINPIGIRRLELSYHQSLLQFPTLRSMYAAPMPMRLSSKHLRNTTMSSYARNIDLSPPQISFLLLYPLTVSSPLYISRGTECLHSSHRTPVLQAFAEVLLKPDKSSDTLINELVMCFVDASNASSNHVFTVSGSDLFSHTLETFKMLCFTRSFLSHVKFLIQGLLTQTSAFPVSNSMIPTHSLSQHPFKQ
jgi:hypothetical protein